MRICFLAMCVGAIAGGVAMNYVGEIIAFIIRF